MKQLLITPLVLYMQMANYQFRLKDDTSKLAAGGTLFQFQQGQWVFIGYHLKF